MSVETLKAALETPETYANVRAGDLLAVCEPLAVGLPLARELLAIAKAAADRDPEKVISIHVAVHGRPLLAAALGSS
jgi:hypothetical protein